MYCPHIASPIFKPTVYVNPWVTKLPGAYISVPRFSVSKRIETRISEVKTNLLGYNKSHLLVISWEQWEKREQNWNRTELKVLRGLGEKAFTFLWHNRWFVFL